MISDIREIVRQKYARAVTQKAGCCGGGQAGGCCGGWAPSPVDDVITVNLYRDDEVKGLPREALSASFGCGNPTALAELREGEVVLDLGSGAGLDVLLAARRVGPGGRVYGLDMTDEMLAEARANQARAGLDNVEFLKGHIEDVPLPANTVDVVISNCVINLSADKNRVLRESYRVLKPGGRLAVADIVLTRPLPRGARQNVTAWTGCIAGALLEREYREKLAAAGFTDIGIETVRRYDFTSEQAAALFPDLSESERREINGAVTSAFIRAKKPALNQIQGND